MEKTRSIDQPEKKEKGEETWEESKRFLPKKKETKENWLVEFQVARLKFLWVYRQEWSRIPFSREPQHHRVHVFRISPLEDLTLFIFTLWCVFDLKREIYVGQTVSNSEITVICDGVFSNFDDSSSFERWMDTYKPQKLFAGPRLFCQYDR